MKVPQKLVLVVHVSGWRNWITKEEVDVERYIPMPYIKVT